MYTNGRIYHYMNWTLQCVNETCGDRYAIILLDFSKLLITFLYSPIIDLSNFFPGVWAVASVRPSAGSYPGTSWLVCLVAAAHIPKLFLFNHCVFLIYWSLLFHLVVPIIFNHFYHACCFVFFLVNISRCVLYHWTQPCLTTVCYLGVRVFQ